MATIDDIHRLIHEGKKAEAISQLAGLIRSGPNNNNISLWLLMAELVDDPAKKRDCFLRVLALDPANQKGHEGLIQLGVKAQPQARPVPLAGIPVSSQAGSEPKTSPPISIQVRPTPISDPPISSKAQSRAQLPSIPPENIRSAVKEPPHKKKRGGCIYLSIIASFIIIILFVIYFFPSIRNYLPGLAPKALAPVFFDYYVYEDEYDASWNNAYIEVVFKNTSNKLLVTSSDVFDILAKQLRNARVETAEGVTYEVNSFRPYNSLPYYTFPSGGGFGTPNPLYMRISKRCEDYMVDPPIQYGNPHFNYLGDSRFEKMFIPPNYIVQRYLGGPLPAGAKLPYDGPWNGLCLGGIVDFKFAKAAHPVKVVFPTRPEWNFEIGKIPPDLTINNQTDDSQLSQFTDASYTIVDQPGGIFSYLNSWDHSINYHLDPYYEHGNVTAIVNSRGYAENRNLYKDSNAIGKKPGMLVYTEDGYIFSCGDYQIDNYHMGPGVRDTTHDGCSASFPTPGKHNFHLIILWPDRPSSIHLLRSDDIYTNGVQP